MEIDNVIIQDLERKSFGFLLGEILKYHRIDISQYRIKYCIYFMLVNFAICNLRQNPPKNHNI